MWDWDNNPSTLFVVPPRQSAEPQAQPCGLRVVVLAGPDSGISAVVDSPRVLVGRGECVDVRLHDPTVSQFHVELRWSAEGIVITDLNSKNGVRAGGVRIERGIVAPGTSLSIGTTTLRVEVAPGQSTAATVETSFGGLVGQSAVMRELYTLLARLARNELSVVIEGETGTGKEEAARVLQAKSGRAAGPFVVLDCTAIPATLASSVLFGHEKGAFTGATERRLGVFEAAHDGVLFIDEIGELPLELQPLLLRVLQSREVVPIGSTRPRKVNVRVISASWRDLRRMVNRGTFREDLYYRLAQATIRMPSLAERADDIPLLAQHFLMNLPSEVPAARAINAEALAMLCARSFPGNVRELRSTIERLAMLGEGPVISAADMTFERILAVARTRAPRPESEQSVVSRSESSEPIEPFKEAKRTMVDEFERSYLQRLVERTQRNLSQAAQIAGLERHNLRELLKKHGLYASSK